MKISIIGTGYVGLVTGACLADKGHDVVWADADAARVAALGRGEAPVRERGLDDLMKRHAGSRLAATTDLAAAVAGTDLTFVAVETPFRGWEMDLAGVRACAAGVGEALRGKAGYHVVAVRSTVVPGTTDEIILPALEKHSGRRAGEGFGVGVNPEFLSEGDAVADFMTPDRIVLGASDARAADALAAVYAGFPDSPVVRTNNKTAEMIRYASNTLLATLVSFSNEIANVCGALGGVDVLDVMRGVHAMKELNPEAGDGRRVRAGLTHFLAAGCGFGGNCLPKDTKALRSHGEKAGVPMRVLAAVLRTNEEQPRNLVGLVREHFPSLRGVRVAVLGLAFKPGKDDLRDSPAVPVVEDLLREGARVSAYDPAAGAEARKVFAESPVDVCDTMAGALEGAACAVLVTAWEEFDTLPSVLASMPNPPLLVDGRRAINKRAVPRYAGVGL